jgi:CheY-like chemotaxis protein
LSTWMVVEDEPDIYEVLLAMFEMWGIEGVAFVDGNEAISWIDDVDAGRYKGELPELALLDVRLPEPGPQGPDVAEKLRQSIILRDVAIVYASAFALNQEEIATLLKKTDGDLFMTKPLPRFNELQKVLEDVLGKRRAKVEAQKPR